MTLVVLILATAYVLYGLGAAAEVYEHERHWLLATIVGVLWLPILIFFAGYAGGKR